MNIWELIIWELYSDTLDAHIMQTARFGVLLSRLTASDIAFRELLPDNQPVIDSINERAHIVEEFGETIEALHATLGREQTLINELANLIKVYDKTRQN